MLGRQPVRVTYAHKRKRLQAASRKLLSSPLEALPPDMDDLTRTQMARRMLKRSRRVALAEQLEDKNVEHIREHLAKRIKRTQEHVLDVDPTEAPFDVLHQDDLVFQTPFHTSQSVHESAVTEPLVPEQLSPVPVSRRIMSRTSSRNLKENSTHSHVLASPFNSRPGSTAPSPKYKGGERPSRRVPRISLRAKSRTRSGAFKENTSRVLRKGSTVSLKDASREPSARHIKHQRFPSSPSTAYMRSQFAQQSWIAPPKALSRTFDDADETLSPGGSFHSNASFYADQPQSCSTPAIFRLRKLPDLHGHEARTDSLFDSSHLRKDSTITDDIEMMDGTVAPRRQTIRLSGNSIFSSSDEFTVGSLPATLNDETTTERNIVTSQDEAPARAAGQVIAHRGVIDKSRGGRSLAGSFVAEYNTPLYDLGHSPISTVATWTLGPEGIRKSSVGKRSLSLLGTSPARGENLVIHSCRNPGVPKTSVAKQPLGLPGTSPARGENLVVRASNGVSKSSVGKRPLALPGTNPTRGENLVVRTSRNRDSLTPSVCPLDIATTRPPSSPASDLAMELQSMDICGHSGTYSSGETRHAAASVPLQTRSLSLQDVSTKLITKKSVKRRPVRNRASTIRASDFVGPSASSGVIPRSTVPSLCSMRRTRSGTVVGPDSKLAAESAEPPAKAAEGEPASRIQTIQSGSGSESDDELLLRGFWLEDLEYLGLAMPQGKKDAEADELNLGGLWSRRR